MSIPIPISTRFAAVSRSKGHLAASRLSYIMGTDLRSERTGERHVNTREDLFHSGVRGWKGSAPEDLQDLVYAVEHAERTRRNAREGQTIITELPTLEGERTSPALARRMNRERERIIDAGADFLHERTRGAVVFAGHDDPLVRDEVPRDLQRHAHYFITRRTSDGQGGLEANVDCFSSMRETGALLDEFRAHLCAAFNDVARRYEDPKRCEPGTYTEIYRTLNEQRTREGVEPLEVPEARQHEGMSGTAVRRKRARAMPGEQIECSPELDRKLAENDAIAQRNAERMQRNCERMGRDEFIARLRPHLAAHDEMSRLSTETRTRARETGEIGMRPEEWERWNALERQRGPFKELFDRAQELPLETQRFLFPDYPDAWLSIKTYSISSKKHEIRRLMQENKGVIRGRGFAD